MAQVSGSTYGNDPENSTLDEVRLLIGDTVCADAKLTDAEINFFLANTGSALEAAADAAESISAKFCMKVDYSTGKVRKSLSQIAESYAKLAARLAARAAEDAGMVFTALDRSVKTTDREDPNLVQPQFRVGQDDNPRKLGTSDHGGPLVP